MEVSPLPWRSATAWAGIVFSPTANWACEDPTPDSPQFFCDPVAVLEILGSDEMVGRVGRWSVDFCRCCSFCCLILGLRGLRGLRGGDGVL